MSDEGKVPGYDPDENENTEYSLEDFAESAREELRKYVLANRDLKDKSPRPWHEWMKDFLNYMSF